MYFNVTLYFCVFCVLDVYFVFVCDSLREAQAVLLRKTQGGEGDKMAALLMKHVEKEKKKLLTVTSTSTSSSSATPSSSVKSSVRTFHTQKGQYTVHFNEPTGQ